MTLYTDIIILCLHPLPAEGAHIISPFNAGIDIRRQNLTLIDVIIYALMYFRAKCLLKVIFLFIPI